MNRILFSTDEIHDGVVTIGDARAEHIIRVLHGEEGQVLKTGEINGLLGTSEIINLDKARSQVSIRVNHNEESLRPWADLILAPPRPRVMKRLLPQLATLGVGRIVLVGANKVEKDFWGATLLKKEQYTPLFVDGLMQAGTTIMPELIVRRNFRKFIQEELSSMFPTTNKIVAHPTKEAQLAHQSSTADRLLLAVGPEGGWTESEVELLKENAFSLCSLGPRILKTETAVISLLARLS
ncbi:MAG: 16S rRNA (uracil(1498)-N(3))-methyltransferase [Kiritimatiellae bacterium]|nr:16S rRNA (uracil(1498)-N(3))-methyltransferase [Kiritimatiellia bacterium]